MAVYERDLRVGVPLEDAWAFHSTIDGLRSLTPKFLNLRVEELERPGNGRDAHVLTEGTRIHASVTPVGFGPRQHWVSVIDARVERDGVRYFVDTMEDGPFREWTHTHMLYGDGEETLIRDRVEYELPGGELGTKLGGLGLLPMFVYRHYRTRDILGGA